MRRKGINGGLLAVGYDEFELDYLINIVRMSILLSLIFLLSTISWLEDEAPLSISMWSGLFAKSVVVVLALFIPVVLALAESVSIQAVTLTLQGLHSSGATWRLVGPAMRREFATAALLGLACGSIVGGVAGAWKGSVMLAVAVGGAIAASMVTAALLGLLLPTMLHAARRDPKIAAGPIVLASADLCTLLIYFNLATTLL